MSGDVSYPDIRAAAKGLVNNAIKALGHNGSLTKLPLGVVEEPLDCPISRAFRMHVPQPVAVFEGHIVVGDHGDAEAIANAWGTEWGDGMFDQYPKGFKRQFGGGLKIYEVDMPRQLVNFVEMFDEGEFPDLIRAQVVADDGGSGDGGTGGAPSLTGGSGSEGGGINAEHGGSEASPAMVGGSEAGGGA